MDGANDNRSRNQENELRGFQPFFPFKSIINTENWPIKNSGTKPSTRVKTLSIFDSSNEVVLS